MSRYLWAALASAVAIASASAADAAVMVFQGQGVITGFRKATITVPDVQVGDAATVSFLYDPARCIIISGACHGGDSAPGLGTGNPYYDLHVTVDGWTTTITGETYDTLAPGAYHVEDGLNFMNVAVPTPAGAVLLTPLNGSSGGAFVSRKSTNIASTSPSGASICTMPPCQNRRPGPR